MISVPKTKKRSRVVFQRFFTSELQKIPCPHPFQDLTGKGAKAIKAIWRFHNLLDLDLSQSLGKQKPVFTRSHLRTAKPLNVSDSKRSESEKNEARNSRPMGIWG